MTQSYLGLSPLKGIDEAHPAGIDDLDSAGIGIFPDQVVASECPVEIEKIVVYRSPVQGFGVVNGHLPGLLVIEMILS